MKILIVDSSQDGVPMAIRGKASGHDIRVFSPPHCGEIPLAGKGMIDRVADWRPHMKWADLIVMTGNSMYIDDLESYFNRGFPIIGANRKAAALELDRALGDDVLTRLGVDTLPYEVFDSYDKAISYVKNNMVSYVCKSWGGSDDKSLSYVSKSPADMVFKLELWKRQNKLKGKFMLQRKAKGIEMATAGWFGPDGFSKWKREIFEEKKFLNDGLGQNTGEMGTIIRYTEKSKLFDTVLAPVEEYLHGLGYVGNVDVNCIVDEDGTPWPLEFTMRFGWPGYNIEMALHKGDHFEWLGDLLEGRDTLRVKTGVAIGIVTAHGDFPMCKWPPKEVAGFPITGITESIEQHVWPQWVMMAPAPVDCGNTVKTETTLCTAGHIVATVTAVAPTVSAARDKVYPRVWAIDWPSNRMFRTDIGCRLQDQLPVLHRLGFAKGLNYA